MQYVTLISTFILFHQSSQYIYIHIYVYIYTCIHTHIYIYNYYAFIIMFFKNVFFFFISLLFDRKYFSVFSVTRLRSKFFILIRSNISIFPDITTIMLSFFFRFSIFFNQFSKSLIFMFVNQ